MSARDLILNSLLKPIDTQVDYSQGYDVGFNAQANRITPEQVRQRDLANAIQRNQQRIQTQITGQDNTLDSASKLLGYNLREQSSANLRGMTPEQRLQSYITGSNHDPELAYDMQNMNDGYLRGKYGDAVADYAYNQRKTAMQDFQRASSYVPEEEQTGNLFTGITGGLTRGVRQIGGIAEQLGIMAFNDGEEQANKLRQAQHDMEEDISSIARWQGSEYQHQDTKAKTFTQLADNLRQQKFQQIAAQTGNNELAKTESDKLAEEYHAGLNVITHELMVNGLGEQAPQILLAILSGGAGAAIAETVAMGISRTVATKAIQAAMPKIIQLGAMTGVGIEAGLQDGTSAAADAHVGVYQYFDQARKEAQQGDNTKWNNLFGSEEMKALAQQYPNASPEELISLAANNASISAGLTSGLYTGVSAGLAAPTLSGFSSKLGAALKPSSRWALTSTAPIIEGATEFGEEYVNIVSPRESINRALGVNVHENPSLYATDQALQAGAIGALAGSASTVAGMGSALGSAGKALMGKGQDYLNNRTKKITKEEKQAEASETEKVVAPLVNDINVFGTSGNEQQEAIDGVLEGKNMSNSKFGEKYRELVYVKAKAENKEVEARDYGSTIYDLDKLAVHNYKQYIKANKEGNTEKANEYGSKVNDWVSTKNELNTALWEDINSVSTEFKTLYDENVALSQEYTQLHNDLHNGLITEEIHANEVAKLDARADDVDMRLTNLGQIGDQFQALAESTLFNVLNTPVGEVSSRNIKLNKLPLKEHLKKLGKPERVIRSIDDVLYHSTSTIKLIEQATSPEEATEYISSWLEEVSNFTPKKTGSAKKIFTDIQTELQKIKDYLDSTPYKLDDNSYLGSIIDKILAVKDFNEGKAKTYLEKFFVGKKSIIGLASRNSMIQLLYFRNSQQRKMEAVLSAYRQAKAQDLILSDRNPLTDIITGTGKTGNPLYLNKSDSSGRVSFSSYENMNSYIKSLREDYDLFDDLVNKIFQENITSNSNLIKRTSESTPEPVQETNTINADTNQSTQSTSSLGSEEENTIPVPKKTKSKKDELPPPPPELTEEEIRVVQESVNRSRKARESIQEESDTNTQPKQENQSESNTEQSKAIPENNPEPRKEEEDNEFISQYEYAYPHKPINVWSGSRENVVLSNLAPFEFDYMNFTFESVEHAYQTLKDGKGLTQENRDWAEEHRDTFSTGKTVKRKVKVDTNKNLNLMFDLLRIRAKDDIDFIDKLSSTELREITHKNPKSSHEDIWTKVFPEMLMILRDEIHSMNDERTREDIITGEISNTEPVQEQEEEEVQDNFGLSDEVIDIYSKLGNKTRRENDRVIIKNGVRAVEQAARNGEGINSLRQFNTDKHFGNPFSSENFANNRTDLIKTSSTRESVMRYIDWVLNSKDERAEWIREQLSSGKLKDKNILYYKELNEPSHATALSYLAHDYVWTNQESNQSSEPVQEVENTETVKSKPVKEKSLVEPVTDNTGSVIGYVNTNSGNTYLTQEEAFNDKEEVREKLKKIINKPELNQDYKTHIHNQIKYAFKQMSEETDEVIVNTFGLKDKVLDNGLTQKTVDRLYTQGYDLNRNLLEDSTEALEASIDVDTVIEALNQDYENLSDEEELEWITKFIRAYNPNLSEEEVNTFLGSENVVDIFPVMQTFKQVLDKVNELFDGENLSLNPVTVTGEQYNDNSHFHTLKRFNAFTNLLQYDEEGNPVYPSELRFAIAKTLMEGISTNILNGRGNHKAQQEFFRQMSNTNPFVYETTLQENAYTIVNSNNNVATVSDTSYWDDPRSVYLMYKDKIKGTDIKTLSKRHNHAAQYDYGNLGRPIFSLLEDFGTDLLTNLNLRFKKDVPSNLVQNITQVLGGEVLGILKANNMLATYRVEFSSNNDKQAEDKYTNNTKLFYGTLIVNSDITKAIPKAVIRAFKGRLSEMNVYKGATKQDMGVLNKLDQSSQVSSFTNGWLNLSLSIADVHKSTTYKMLQGNTERNENFIILGSKQAFPENFGSRTNTDPILLGTPKELREAVKNHDKIAYGINLDNLNLFENNREAWRLLGGWVSPKEIEKHIPTIQESLTAKNNAITRVEATIEEYIARAKEVKEDISKVKFYFSHTVTQTQRIQFDQPISVQNDKLMREMFVAKAKQFTELNTELAKQNQSMDWAISDLETLIAPVETSMTVPKHEGTRDINFLIEKIEDLSKKVAKKKTNTNVKHYEQLSALMLGVSQALGVKIERFREANILIKLRAEFKSRPWLENLADTLWDLHNNPTRELTEEELGYFQSARNIYGSSATRLYSALNAYAQFKHLPNGSKLDTNFYLEADGIGNGMSNLVRQFTRGFTPTYFNTLKRVGITTFDMIVKFMNQKGWDFDNLSKEDLNNLGNMLEGSAKHFDPETNENGQQDNAILDVYETVADFAQKKLERGLNYLLSTEDTSLNNDRNYAQLHKALGLKKQDELEDVTLADLLSHVAVIDGIIERSREETDTRNLLTNSSVPYTGLGNDDFVEFWETVKSLAALSVLEKSVKINDTSLSDIIGTSLLSLAENLPNLKIEIKRNLAKLGVTPAMYGGGVSGISNQVTTDILAALQEKLDELYVKLSNEQTLDRDLATKIITVSLALNLRISNNFLELKIKPEDIIRLSETIRKERSFANRAIKNSVGKILYEGVQDRYGEFLKNGNAVIAAETAILDKLAIDLKAQYDAAITERNKKAWEEYSKDKTKGWSKTDPRNTDALTRAVERKILLSLPSLPLFATSFSNKEVLVDNLLREGHTISKKRDITDRTGGITPYALSNFEAIHDSLPYSNTFAFKVVNRLRSYSSGGATIFTNSVVSTESKVQAVVNTVLKKIGRAILNVFDGLDANSLLRNIVGQIANKAYNEIHLDTNLQESIFHRVNRSNLVSSLVPLELNGSALLLEGLTSESFADYHKKIINTFAVINEETRKVTGVSDVKLELSSKELQFLDALASVVATLDKGTWSESAASLRTSLSDATTNLLTLGSDKVTIEMNPEHYLKLMEGFINFGSDMEVKMDYVSKSHVLYNQMLETLADKAATVHAMKEIERTLLAFNVNQFAGANRGYFHNADTFFTNKELVQRFRDFLNDNSNLDGTEALVQFINTDTFIQEKMSQYKAKKIKELKPAYKDTTSLNNALGLNNESFGSITTVRDALDYLENLPDDNSIQSSTRKTLISFMRVESVSELDKPVYTTAENFEKYVKPVSPDTHVNGGVHNSDFIYVSENRNQKEEILLHELVHSVSVAVIKDYFENNGSNIRPETREAIKQIELNALKFADLFINHPRVLDILNQANNLKEDSLFFKQDIFGTPNNRIESVAAALILGRNTNSPQLRYNALTEFLAYGLTSDSLVNAIYYQKRAFKEKENIENKTLLRALINLRKFIDKVKAQIRNLFFGSYAETKVDHSMLFDILANLRVVSYDNAKVRESSNNTQEEYYTDEENNSLSNHEQYLNRLQRMVNTSGITKQLNQVDYIREKNIFELQEVHNLKNAVKGIIPKLRNQGITFTQQEVSMFNTMSALNAVIFDANPSLRTEAERWMNKVLEADINKFPLDTLLQGSEFDLPTVIALAMTNEQIKKSLEKVGNASTRISTLENKFNDLTVYIQASKSIKGFKNQNTLTKLAYAIASSNLDTVLTEQRRDEIYEEELKRYEKGLEFARNVSNISGLIPKPFAKLVVGVTSDWVNSKGLLSDSSDEESTIGRLLTYYAEKHSEMKGMPTWVTQALRLVLQARTKTHYIYAMRSKFVGAIEQARETVRQVIPEVIYNYFDGNYTKEIDNTIATSVLPINLVNVFMDKTVDMNVLQRIVQDKTAVRTEIDDTILKIREVANSKFGARANEVVNLLTWQAEGLGSMMLNRSAKSVAGNISHFILPNPNAIASLFYYRNNNNKTFRQEANKNMDLFRDLVAKLATLHSLVQLDGKDFINLRRLAREHTEGLQAVLEAQISVSDLSTSEQNYDFIGTEGFVHSQQDPNISIQIVHRDSNDRNRLIALGYTEEAYLSDSDWVVMRSMINPVNRYQTGSFGSTEVTYKGTSIASLEPLHSVTANVITDGVMKSTYQKAFQKTVERASRTPNYYKTLKVESNIKPVVSPAGYIATYSTELPTNLKKQLVTITDTGTEALGNMMGRIMEENRVQDVNAENVRILNQKYRQARDKRNYVLINGQAEVTGSKAQQDFAKRLNDFYWVLPYHTRQLIDNEGGLWIYRNELDNVIGYRHLDITDLWTGKSSLPKPVQDLLKSVFKIFQFTGAKPANTAKVTQDVVKEIVSAGKDVVLNKSVVVGAGNIISNVIHLLNVGVPHETLANDLREGLINAQNYVRNNKRLTELEYKLAYASLSHAERRKMEAEVKFIEDSMKNNPVMPLVEGGVLSTIAGVSGYEHQFDTSKDFTYRKKLLDKVGISGTLDKLGNTNFGRALENVLILEGTTTHDFMVRALDYGDFVARYALFKHLTQNRGFSEERAMNVIREEFINYTMNRGKYFDYSNALGLTWFASYALGIQKVIYKALRRNTLSTLAIYGGGRLINDYDRLGLIGTVPNQNLFERSWDYTTSTSNVLDSFESHYFGRLLAWLFQ